jgi:glycosyltransferase involved in cell wall biosynthesis
LQYRWQQPLEQLRARGHKIVVLPDVTDAKDDNYEKNLDICTRLIVGADVLYMNSPGFTHTMQMLMGLKKANPNLKLVGDFDDDQFNISPANQAYRYCGLKEVKVNIDGEWQWLWKQGEKNFDLKRNRNNAKATAIIISMLDLMFTTTERLKFKYRKYLDKEKIVIAPNGINYEFFDLYEKRVIDDKIRIVWPVSSSHLTDWMDIRTSLGNVLKRNKNTVLVTLGVEMGGGRDIPLSQHEHIGWAMGYAGYLNNLFTCGADIGICPLSDNRFNWKKSPLKWEEISSLKLPSVVSSVMYGDYVKDGETGLVYNSNKEFEEKLQQLIDSAELRKRIGENAYTEVRENYNILKIANTYESSLEKLCGTNKIIEVVK